MQIKGLLSVGLFWVTVYIIASFVSGALLWTYAINTWLVYTGKEAVVEWWMGGLLGLVPVVGQFSIPAAVLTWIIMLFLVA